MRTDPRVRQAAFGTAVVFTASGSLLGTWVSRLPAVLEELDATPGQLGLALLALGAGSLIAMPMTGHICRKFGSRPVIVVTATAACLALAAVGAVGNLATLAAVLFGFGVVYGASDVSMNVHGSFVDQRAGRQWMSQYHACWSVGNILGAGAGALAARADVGLPTHFLFAAIAALALWGLGLTRFLDDRPQSPETSTRSGAAPARGGVFSRHLLMIGLVTLMATTVEGAAADWLAIYLADERGTSDAMAALGFAVFAAAMTAGRFAGTPITERLGRARAVRIGGVLGVAGVLMTVLAPGLPLAYAGMVLWAVGICLVFPAAVSAAGETARPAESIAMVTTLGYGAILVGPPLIGTLADQIGLGRALLVLVVLSVGVVVLAPAVRETPRGDGTTPPQDQPRSASIAR